MKIKELNPNQIITSNYEILHDLHILKIYFRIYQKECSQIIPPAPVIHKDLVIKYFDDNLKQVFEECIKQNLEADYFLLDGSHKTTAANLTNSKCKVMIFENEKDILKAKEMANVGEIFQYLLKDTIQGIVESLLNHFNKKRFFQTVDEKTKKLIQNKSIPNYMIEYYKKGRKD